MSDSAVRSRIDAAVAADMSARARALDVAQSFLVQAPAGSGKTELLIQRFLALLAHVDRPERIVAMTFTRKAAGEMRERIVRALAEAAEDARHPVATPHAQRTRELAKAALLQDARQGWHLTAHPARLSVQTIDAFCAGLARQAPLATRLGAVPRIEERARPLYETAVREALADADADDPDWRRLLAHFDNDAAQAVALLAGMLGKRDQWLRELPRGERAAFRAQLEASLAQEIRGELATIAAAFPAELVATLPLFQRYAAENAVGARRAEGVAANLIACAEAGGLPPVAVDALDDWRALASWLLIAKEAQFRKTIDKDGGFPAKASGEGALLRAERNDGMRALLGELAAVPGLADALDAARRLPPPSYTDDAWSVVSALLDLLPRLAARLTMVFRDAGALDFTQGTLGALAALGDEDAPTDLLLKLDLRIDHLLIDEFQDTSYPQLMLLRRLTARLDAGRRAHAVRGRRSDAVDLSLSRSRGAHLRRGAGAEVGGGRAGGVPGARAQFSLACGTRRVGQRRLSSRARRPQRSMAQRGRVRARHVRASRASPRFGDRRPRGRRDRRKPIASSAVFALRWTPAASRSPFSFAHARTSIASCRHCGRQAFLTRRSGSTRSPNARPFWISPRSRMRSPSRRIASRGSRSCARPGAVSRCRTSSRWRRRPTRIRRNRWRRCWKRQRPSPGYRTKDGSASFALRNACGLSSPRAGGRRSRAGCGAPGSHWAAARRSTTRSTSTPRNAISRCSGNTTSRATFRTGPRSSRRSTISAPKPRSTRRCACR